MFLPWPLTRTAQTRILDDMGGIGQRVVRAAASYATLSMLLLQLTHLIAALPDYIFTRGEAPPGEQQFYGCDDPNNCDTDPLPAPPYDPEEPKRCRRHRQWMKTPVFRILR